MPDIKIRDLRFSVLWVETLPGLVDGEVPDDRPLAFLADDDGYATRFELVSEEDPQGLEPPWPSPAGQRFWTYYLGNKTPGSITGKEAWKQLIPFRGRLPAKVTADWLKGWVTLEAFYYPHGLALVATVVSQEPLTLEAAVDRTLEMRGGGEYQVVWEPGQAPQTLKLKAIAGKALARLKQSSFGPDLEGTLSSPFSIATIVRAEGIDPKLPNHDKDEVHSALEGLTSGRSTWKDDDLDPLAEARLPTRTAPASHVLHGRRRGRTVWFPATATEQQEKSALACYHRNLLYAALQVESLAGLVLDTEERRSKNLDPVGYRRRVAQRAAGILGRLYGGSEKSYRSWSPRAHIEDNGWLEAVDSLRDYFNMKKLETDEPAAPNPPKKPEDKSPPDETDEAD